MPHHKKGFDGSVIDGSLFTSITNFAQHTPIFHQSFIVIAKYSWVIFLLLIPIAWCCESRKPRDKIPNVCAILCSIAVATVVEGFCKNLFKELRPCRSLPHDFFLAHCPEYINYSMPSGHSTFAATTAVSLYFLNRSVGMIAGILLLILGFSRIYIGAHYPHDIVCGIVIGGTIAYVLGKFIPHLWQKMATMINQR